MKPALLSCCCALALTAANIGCAESSQPGTLCRDNERTVFSCPLDSSAKLVSLCGSRDLAKGSGSLQYRFGRSGEVELEFPKDRHDSREAFRHSHYARYQVDRFAVSFSSKDHRYTVFDDRDGETAPPTHKAGVAVTPPGQKPRELLCRGTATGNLRELESIVPCDKADALNMDACG